MYTPAQFSEGDQGRIEKLIRDHGFATLVSVTADAPLVTHAPLQMDSARNVLVGHLARANPHAALLQNGAPLLAIFHGPHAYISPTWYRDENPLVPNVPTWNYAVVHVSGRVTRIDGDGAKWLIVHDLAMQYEADAAAPWDARGLLAHAGKLGAIVGFEMAIERIDAKFKLTQNRSVADQQGVISALQGSDSSEAQATATLMRENLRAV